LHVYGLVQGVGFRPYVAELCKELSIVGTVRNSGGIVIIEASGAEASLASLREKLEALDGKNPVLPGARVDLIEEEPWACADTSEVDEVMPSEGAIESPVAEMHLVESSVGEMRIVESDSFEESVRFLPPDIATCPRCEKELLDPANRRYRYPFISCFSCGPRYTIMDAVPYDREHTTMKTFPLCEECKSDYEEFGNPRHFAQTIAC
jgi:hydrogenase maturation protein HypF